MSMSFDIEVDAAGLNCPVPVLRAKKAISGLNSGQVMRLLSTDPGSIKDFEAFCRQTGHALLAQEEHEGTFVFYIRHH